MDDVDGGGGGDDDAFYEDLKRQVLLLRADEDAEDFAGTKRSNLLISEFKAGANSSTGSLPRTLETGCYFSWWEREYTDSVPAWLVSLWRNGNGTGVFIPQIVEPWRKYRQHGKMNYSRRRVNKRVENDCLCLEN